MSNWLTINPEGRLNNPKWWPHIAAGWGAGYVSRPGTAGRVNLTPFWIPRPMIVSKITCQISTGGGAGTKYRLGLYSDNGGTPASGGLLYDSGDIDATVTGVIVQTLPNPLSISSGYLWGALETQDAVIVWQGMGGQPNFNDITGEALVGCFYSQSYGALANPCPSITSLTTANFATRLRIDQIL